MRFHLPFDNVQWFAASKSHRQMRTNLRKLRQQYPPRSDGQAALLKAYRDVMQQFARELLKPRGRINPARLNELSDDAVKAFIVYARVYGDADRGD